jgi:hypothetical protein
MGGSGGIVSKFAIGMASSFVVVAGASAAAVVPALAPVLVVVGVAAAKGAAASVIVPVVPVSIVSSMFSTAQGPGMIGFCLCCAAMAGGCPAARAILSSAFAVACSCLVRRFLWYMVV